VKATVENKRGITVIHLEGEIEYVHSNLLEQKIDELYASKRNEKLIFNLEGLQFVGSTGIKPFIQMLKRLNQKKGMKPRFVGLPPEYERLFKAYETKKKPFSIFDSEQSALKSYRQKMWTKKGNA